MMFKIDLHIHSSLGGDSMIEPDELVPRAVEVGLDAVCATEHNSYALSQPFEEITKKTGFPIFRGMEYNANEGHLLIFGVKAGRGDLPPGLPMQHVLDWVSKSTGIAIPAHPYQIDMLGRSLGKRLFELRDLVALETMNGSLPLKINKKASEAALRLGIHGIGGSDAHGLSVLGKVYTLFNTPIRTDKELVTALKAGGYGPCRNGYYSI